MPGAAGAPRVRRCRVCRYGMDYGAQMCRDVEREHVGVTHVRETFCCSRVQRDELFLVVTVVPPLTVYARCGSPSCDQAPRHSSDTRPRSLASARGCADDYRGQCSSPLPDRNDDKITRDDITIVLQACSWAVHRIGRFQVWNLYRKRYRLIDEDGEGGVCPRDFLPLTSPRRPSAVTLSRSGQEAIVLSCRAWAGGPPTGIDDAPCHRHR